MGGYSWNFLFVAGILEFIAVFFIYIQFGLIVSTLLETKVNWKRYSFDMLILSFIIATLSLFLEVNGYFMYFWQYSLIICFDYLLYYNIVYYFFEKDKFKAVINASLAYFIMHCCVYFARLLFHNKVLNIFDLKDTTLYLFVFTIASSLVLMVMNYILKRIRFPSFINFLISNQKTRKMMMTTSLLLPILTIFLKMVSKSFGEYNKIIFSYTSMLLLIIILLIISYVSSAMIHSKVEETQKTLLMQQQMYVQNLEGIQQEMRLLRHDYKNMMSSLYLQAKEGQLDEIQDFFQRMSIDFDENIGESIRQTSHIMNIQILEIKSLLLVKIMEMQSKDITFELEVLYPVNKIGMNGHDFSRCLGILIDNAIEEVVDHQKPVIEMMLSYHEKCLTLSVKNKVNHPIDFYKIGKTGYSTKGEDRGLGLSSYQKIIEKYQNATPLTSLKESVFIQELKIQEG